VIGQAQYDTWKANFGNTSGSGSLSEATVPETDERIVADHGIDCGVCTSPLALSLKTQLRVRHAGNDEPRTLNRKPFSHPRASIAARAR